MRTEGIELSRIEEVREAAAGWKAASGIDGATLAAIEAEYPDDRVRLHRVWRVILFVLVSVAVLALFESVFDARGAMPSFAFAALLAAGTEALERSRFSATGAAGAISFWALGFLLLSLAILLMTTMKVARDPAATVLLGAACVAGAAAAWRWGFWFYAAAAAAALFLFAARIHGGRISWIVLAGFLVAVSARRLDRASIAPPHRRSLAAILGTCAAALYTAVNLYAFDRRWIEAVESGDLFSLATSVPEQPALLRLLSIAATAALPVAFLAWGIRTRRTLLLAIGLAASALSVATFRFYVPVGPRWAFIAVCGAFLIAVALWIHRRLREAPGGAWRGLTASPLYSRGGEGVSPLAALGAGLATHVPAEAEPGGLSTGGGEFGGGGASGRF
jgi:hypothetical protein